MELSGIAVEDLPHYTYDDYAQWEGQWELIAGIPYSMAPSPMMKHQRISFKIASQLDSLLSGCEANCYFYEAIDWQITEDTIVQPDVLVVCGDFEEGKKLETTPVLVFEILSPSTRKKDRVLKYRLYQEAGVKYYCMVDPTVDSIEVFQLAGDSYREEDGFKDGKILFELGECEIALDSRKIFVR